MATKYTITKCALEARLMGRCDDVDFQEVDSDIAEMDKGEGIQCGQVIKSKTIKEFKKERSSTKTSSAVEASGRTTRPRKK